MYITLHSLLLQEARGALAQVVEQWTENPCVPGSTPGGTTFKRLLKRKPHEIQIFHGVSFLHGPLKKHNSLIYNFFCGETGIRTPGTSRYNGFQDRRYRPLSHLSKTL